MKTNLLMDFSIDKSTNTINVKREFAAPKDTVWAAWTEPELLDQWWAPKPWKAKTKTMDFREGGQRLYAMVGPKGEEQWCLANFKSIAPKTNFKYHDAFCDNQGNINATEFPGSDWNVDFIGQHSSTMVNVSITYNSLANLEKTIAMGFKEGFILAMDGLDEIFSTLKK